jgi:5'-nucleotidase
MTGMLLGIRSIALSQVFKDRNAVKWGRPGRWQAM